MARGRMDSIGDLSVAAEVASLKAEVRYKLVTEYLDQLYAGDPFLSDKLRLLVNQIIEKEYITPEELIYILKTKNASKVITELQTKLDFFEEKARESLLPSSIDMRPVFTAEESPSGVQSRTVQNPVQSRSSGGVPLAGFARRISTILEAVVPTEEAKSSDKTSK